MQKIRAEFELNTGKSKENLEQVVNGTDDLKDGLKNVEKQGKKTNKALDGISKVLKGMFIIQGLQLAFDLFKETLGQNQKVVDAFAVATESLSLVFNDFFRFLNNNVGTVIDYFKGLFENPVQSLKNFGQAIFDNVIERVKSALDALGFLGTAVVKVFEGDFAGAAESAKNAGKELLDVVTGVDNSFDKAAEILPTVVDGISKYTKSVTEAAKANVELNKQAQLAEVINQGLIEKYDRQAELLRQTRDDESKTIQERIEANTKLAELLDKQEEAMLENSKIAEKAARAQLAKDENNLEAQIALQQALNETASIEAQITGFRSEQKMNEISLNRELKESIEEKNKAEQEGSEESLKIEKLTTEQKLDLASNALGNISQLVGEGSKVGKAAAIAQTTIETYKGAQSAFSSLAGIPVVGPALGAVAAAAAIAGGIANVKQITAIGDPVSAPSISSTPISVPTAPSQAPDFNVVGASDTNQLAQAIGSQQQQPVKAFVVSNDVTTTQGIKRNIVEGASIG